MEKESKEICMNCEFSCNMNRRCKLLKKPINAKDRSCELFRPVPDPEIPSIVVLETNVMYIMSRAIEILIADIDKKLKETSHKYYFDLEKKSQFAEVFKDIEQFNRDYYKIEQQFVNGTRDGNKNTVDWKVYDQFRDDANELIRLSLLFGDRCSNSQRKVEGLFRYIKAMSSKGILKDEDLERFVTNTGNDTKD